MILLAIYLYRLLEDCSHRKDLCQGQYQEYRQVVDLLAVVFLAHLLVVASPVHGLALALSHHLLLLYFS